ncbi:hypothetical protein Ahy_A07g034213 [Arachis hypogaea]|uniref:Small ribosomal subunit protein uS3 C-terminal domain-containing protein n=1 Tax=Arachis hypogaea TaxID=3818 RepID=A0A445CB98_ARAHY|nr:hypothetical protein Ahy_A07g034213 [Arachis hypogaea]
MKKGVEGIRICCSGRSEGAEIARTECGKYGKTSRNVFNQKINYASAEVSNRYGILSVKVWISYSKKNNMVIKYVSAILLISFCYLIIHILSKILQTETLGIIKQIPMFMGGASAFYFIFKARTRFSKLMTLYSFMLSSSSLFVGNHVHEPNIAILVVICVCCSFFFSSFLSRRRSPWNFIYSF